MRMRGLQRTIFPLLCPPLVPYATVMARPDGPRVVITLIVSTSRQWPRRRRQPDAGVSMPGHTGQRHCEEVPAEFHMNDIPNVSGPPNDAPHAELIGLLRWIKWWLIVLTLMVAALWVLYVAQYLLSDDTPPAAAHVAPRDETIVGGPWGRIEIVPTRIAPDPDLVDEGRNADEVVQVVWYFPVASMESLEDLLLRIPLPKPLRSTLLGLATPVGSPARGYEVRPDRKLVLGLDNETRAKFYLALVNHPRNFDQRGAFRFCGTSSEQWLDGADISPQTARLVAPLIYRRGELLFFADWTTVSPMLPSAGERNKLMMALARESTFILKLKLDPDSDIDALTAYWGRGGRETIVRQTLAAARARGAADIDVVTLLPPFARDRLYKYPHPTPTSATVLHDCHWTALNFFSESQTPDDRFGLPNRAFDTFRDDYRRISEDQGEDLNRKLRFGDLVTYTDRRGAVIHSAVYIAAGILFTKNGRGPRPWTLTRLSAMHDYYPLETPLLIRYFRPKAH